MKGIVMDRSAFLAEHSEEIERREIAKEVGAIYFSKPKGARNLLDAMHAVFNRRGISNEKWTFLESEIASRLGHEGGKQTSAQRRQGKLELS